MMSKVSAWDLLKKYGLDGSDSFRYQMLDRMRLDCAMYEKHRHIKYLWAKDVDLHIRLMKALYVSFETNKKPEWISMSDIQRYKNLMSE